MNRVTIPQTRAEARALERASGTNGTAPMPSGTGFSIGFALGLIGALIGIAPWLLTGAKLPLQNLWGSDTLPENMPTTLLPVSQYYAVHMVCLILVGGLAAGLLVRLLSARIAKAGRWGGLAGLTLGFVVIIGQAFLVTGLGLATIAEAQIYLAGLAAGTIVAAVLALVVFYFATSTSKVLNVLAIATMAVPLSFWPVVLFVQLFWEPALGAVQWLPGIVAGLGLAWLGVRKASTIVVWAITLALLWLLPAVFTAVQAAFGERNSLGDFPEMIRGALDQFASAIIPGGIVMGNIIVALVIGAIGAVGQLVLARRRASASAPTT